MTRLKDRWVIPLDFSGAVETHGILRSRLEADEMIDGFSIMKAVSFDGSPREIVDLVDSKAYEHVELLLGRDLTADCRETAQKETLERLVALIADGRAGLFVPKKGLVHSKLFLLEAEDGRIRWIKSSFNFTTPGFSGKMKDGFTQYDTQSGSDWARIASEIHERYKEGFKPFLDDLADLVRKGEPPEKVVEAWLTTDVKPNGQARKVLADLMDQVARPVPDTHDVIVLETGPVDRRSDVGRLLKRAEARSSGDGRHELEMTKGVEVIQDIFYGMPVLTMDVERLSADLVYVRRSPAGSLDIVRSSRSEPLPEPIELCSALEHLEAYVDLARLGYATDPGQVRMSLWESLLGVLASPFAHEEMNLSRRRSRFSSKPGPPLLFIYGSNDNGKTTLLKFAMGLVAGTADVEPINGNNVKGTDLLQARIGNRFPLVVDDLPRKGNPEKMVKDWWNPLAWREDEVSAQLVVSTNRSAFPDYARPRSNRILLDIKFERNQRNEDAVHGVFERKNPIFAWFAHLYLSSLRAGDVQEVEDSLGRARRVLIRLYEHAQRTPPEDFPCQPLKTIHDPDRLEWLRLLSSGQAKILRGKHAYEVRFDASLQFEVQSYRRLLPQTVKVPERGGGLNIRIENPDVFEKWLGIAKRNGFLGGLFHWFTGNGRK